MVSSSEVELLGREAPEAFAVELPLARPIVPPINAYAARTGIGFIGGFKHLPNLDALRWFVSEVWPLVLDVLPECHFSVVGPDLPADSLVGVPGPDRNARPRARCWTMVRIDPALRGAHTVRRRRQKGRWHPASLLGFRAWGPRSRWRG